MRSEARVVLAIRLVAPAAVPRLPEAEYYMPPLALEARPPLLSLSAGDASTAAKILLAAAAFPIPCFAPKAIPDRGFPPPALLLSSARHRDIAKL